MTADPSSQIRCRAVAPAALLPSGFALRLLGVWIGTMASAAVLLAWRRAAGALSTPLDPPILVLAGIVAATSAAGWRIAHDRQNRRQSVSRLDWPRAVMPSVVVLLVGATLSLPGSDTASLFLLWAILAGEEAWAWRRAIWRALRRPTSRLAGFGPVRTDGCEAPAPHFVPAAPHTSHLPDGAVQQLTRVQAADGSDELTGWLRAAFQGGQRLASIHVAFCPPFQRIPQVVAQQLGGPEARLNTTQVLPYGARLDLKLAVPAEQPDSVLLHFTARTDPKPVS